MSPVGQHIALLDSISSKEIPNAGMLRALAARSLSILLQKNSALVVLEQNIVLDLVALCLHKIPRPTDRHNFGLRRTVGVELLLS
jgi:hypothetical protein